MMWRRRKRSLAPTLYSGESFAQRVTETLDGLGTYGLTATQQAERRLLEDDSLEQRVDRGADVLDVAHAVELVDAILNRLPSSVEVSLYRDSVSVLAEFDHPHNIEPDGKHRAATA